MVKNSGRGGRGNRGKSSAKKQGTSPKVKGRKALSKEQSEEIATIAERELAKAAKKKAAREQLLQDKKDREAAVAKAKRSTEMVEALARAKAISAEAQARRKANQESRANENEEQDYDVETITDHTARAVEGFIQEEPTSLMKKSNSAMSRRAAARVKANEAEWEAQKAEANETAEAMSKRKDLHPPGEEVTGSRIRSENKKDPATSSPQRKKPRGVGVIFLTEEEELGVEDEQADGDVEMEEVQGTSIVSPPVTQAKGRTSNLRNPKPSMLEAAKKGMTEKEKAPIFRQPGHNKEGIPASEFSNKVFIEPTITIPPKPDDFSGTHQQWALQQFTDWFSEAQEQVGPSISLILLQAFQSSSSEPEATKDVGKYLKGTQKTIKKHLLKFNVNSKKASSGKEYQMYLKIRIGTNVHGEDWSQLLSDLQSISPSVQVWESPLQKADVVCLGFLKNSHRNIDAKYLTQLAGNIATKLSAGTCKNNLPGLYKEAFKGRDHIELAFKWKPIWDGYNKESRVNNKKEQLRALHVLCEKKDRALANCFVSALIESPVLSRFCSLEFRLSPLYSSENGPAEKAKFITSLTEHKYIQDHLITVNLPELLSLDIRADLPDAGLKVNPDDSATVAAEKRNPTAR